MPDLVRFARRAPAVVVAAVVAQLAGDLSTVVLRELIVGGDTSLIHLLERIASTGVGGLAGGPIIAFAFRGVAWSALEVGAVAASVILSFRIGPTLADLGEPILGLEARLIDVYWVAAIIPVLAIAEFAIWRNQALRRIRETYAAMWRAATGTTSGNVAARSAVDHGLRRLRAQETEETAKVVTALQEKYGSWLASPSGEIQERLIARVELEMLRLYGPPN
jgi:hypothetical protein